MGPRPHSLGDVVWVIRRYRPDVIFLGFSGTPRDGHGQHQTSAILGKEAFTAAADPTKFPEQLKYVQVWQAKRLLQAAGFGGLAGAAGQAADAVDAAAAATRSPHRRRNAFRPDGLEITERTAGRYRLLQPHPRLLLRGTGRAQPQHAPQPGHRRHAASRRRPRQHSP